MREPPRTTRIAATARALMIVIGALSATDVTPRIGRRVVRECTVDRRDDAGGTLAVLAEELRAWQEIDDDEKLLEVPAPPCRSRWSRVGGGSRSHRCRP